MSAFIRNNWLPIALWTGAAGILWYALVDRSKLGGAIGLIATGALFEIIYRVPGSEDRP